MTHPRSGNTLFHLRPRAGIHCNARLILVRSREQPICILPKPIISVWVGYLNTCIHCCIWKSSKTKCTCASKRPLVIYSTLDDMTREAGQSMYILRSRRMHILVTSSFVTGCRHSQSSSLPRHNGTYQDIAAILMYKYPLRICVWMNECLVHNRADRQIRYGAFSIYYNS
jgi:hypothetical protein